MDSSVASKSHLSKFGVSLVIDPQVFVYGHNNTSLTWAIDCETDEEDNFVGLSLYNGSEEVYYFTKITKTLVDYIKSSRLIGHGLKGDARWLKSWGFDIKSSQFDDDTMLRSYVINATKDSHSLKDLAKEYLNIEWPTYKQMVHPNPDKPGKKVTLDKQDVKRVADYCCCDAVATWQLNQYFKKVMNPTQHRIYNEIEFPLMRLLFDMEVNGVTIDTIHLNRLDQRYELELGLLAAHLIDFTHGEVNINSPKQLKPFIESLVSSSIKNTNKNTLKTLHHPFIDILLQYKRTRKIHSTYIRPFINSSTLPKIHCDYNQVAKDQTDELVGISTGRLSCRHPNLQNIPVHGIDGQEIRKLFIPKEGHTLICADYSQIEYRLLAHFSQEPRLLEAFRNGKDVHTETGLALGVDRNTGKTLNFAAIYGAGAKKIAQTANVFEAQAEKFLSDYWKVLPKVRHWIEKVKYEAHIRKGVYTFCRRFIPLPKIKSSNIYETFHWERAAVNYIIQGSAAEIIKMAMLKFDEIGGISYMPILTVHDELLFEVPGNNGCDDYICGVEDDIKAIMESVVKLDVPLIVDVKCGSNWSEAKGGK